ncbi:hypothetical protein HA075_21735 [bacterium BFN5]|nr:hypothetical protein HA075_21735 [bacterium BFN5]
MNGVLKRFGMKMRDDTFPSQERQFGIRRLLLLFLLTALVRRHRRMVYVYSLRGEPMNDYLKESLTMEREHMADLITMIHSSL